MSTALDWISGISWTLVYAWAILFGIRKKTYLIPAFCVCLNFSWEFCVVLMRFATHSELSSGFISQLLWLILDIGVAYTWLRYTQGSRWRLLLLLCGTAVVMISATIGLGLWVESAFLINFIMSVGFLFKADGEVYSSMVIAVLKCVGTLSATILNGVLFKEFFILTVGGLCLLADLWYIWDLRRKIKQNKKDISGTIYETSCKTI